MPLQRSLSWSAALTDIRRDRVPVEVRCAAQAAIHAARIEAMQAARGRSSKLWTAEIGFDRKAIMATAVADARAILRGSLARGCWRTAMSEALRSTWAAAHAARRATAH